MFYNDVTLFDMPKIKEQGFKNMRDKMRKKKRKTKYHKIYLKYEFNIKGNKRGLKDVQKNKSRNNLWEKNKGKFFHKHKTKERIFFISCCFVFLLIKMRRREGRREG